jgi:hypothetical protein
LSEQWEFVGYGGQGDALEIFPGIKVWDHKWYTEGGPIIQLGESATGPFVYLPVYVIVVEEHHYVFAAGEVRMDWWVFYRRHD